MDDLAYLREEINEINDSMVELFKKRMEIVSKIAEYKRKNSMDVLDKAREEEIINKYTNNVENEALKIQLQEFLESLMYISRKAQKEMLYKNLENHITQDTSLSYKVGFQGITGCFSHQASLEYFGQNVKTVYYNTFKDVFEAVNSGEIKYGVLPIENSSTGGIAEVYDLLRQYNFYIVGEKCIKVDHNLLGIKGTQISDIKEVYSHSQGFLQCNEFFDNYPSWRLIPYFNTAKSAQYISKQNSKSKACVANKKSAEIYELDILKENINHNSNNYTRFIIISKDLCLNEQCNKISVVMALPHKAGALYSVLKYFSENNCNMLKIESRPILHKSWQYFFYIDFSGNMLKENTKTTLQAIENECLYFKLLGSYQGEVNCL